MQLLKKIILFVTAVAMGSFLFTYFYGSSLFMWEVKLIWPTMRAQDVQPDEFKKGSHRLKASMAYTAVKNQYAKGWKIDDVVKQLGPADINNNKFSRWYKRAIGYKLEKLQPNSWNLVFYYNKKGVVTDVRIERQILGDTVFGAVIHGLAAPVIMLYFVAHRILDPWLSPSADY